MKNHVIVFMSLFFTIVFIQACNHNESDSSIEVGIYEEDTSIALGMTNSEKQSIEQGDTSAYIFLRENMSGRISQKDFLFWPLIMANHHGFTNAHIDFFNTLLDYYVEGSIENYYEIDTVTQHIMMQHLLKAKEEGVSEAQVTLSKLKAIELQKPEKLIFDTTYVPSSDEDKVFYKGDIEAYGKLKWKYAEQIPEDFLFWAIFMANRYDHDEAYFDVFNSIYNASSMGDLKFEDLDETTTSFAFKYLDVSIERQVSGAEEISYKLRGTDEIDQ